MKWFKFYGGDYLSDPKILSLTASERSCWITLLCYASLTEDGKIRHLTEEILITQAGISFDPYDDTEMKNLKDILKKFEALSMITFDNGTISITNWKKRQESNLTGYERVKRFRAKNKGKTTLDNEMITLDKTRLDKNIISDSAKKPNTVDIEDKDITYSPLQEDLPKESRSKEVMRLVDWYDSEARKLVGGDPRVSFIPKGYFIVIKLLKKYSLEEIRAALIWYLDTDKFNKYPQISAALSPDSLRLYSKDNDAPSLIYDKPKR